MISNALLSELEKKSIEYKRELELKNFSTFRVGGVCAVAVFPDSAEKLALCLELLDGGEIPLHVTGKGSNTLFSDGYIDRAVVFTSKADGVSINGSRITAESGVGIISLANLAARQGLSGMEFASGIPGSIGGAMYMNAGAYGSEMADITVYSRAFDRKAGEVMTVTEHSFSYRSSIYKRRSGELICLETTVELKAGDTKQIRELMRELSDHRRAKQPLEYPSAGSYFKRPEGDFAGRLIEACGLKGARVGDAQISEKHAGFMINRGNASLDDIMRLESLVKETVLRSFGVELEREVEILR